MIKKFKSMDPMTKSLVKVTAVQIAITAACYAAMELADKKHKTTTTI